MQASLSGVPLSAAHWTETLPSAAEIRPPTTISIHEQEYMVNLQGTNFYRLEFTNRSSSIPSELVNGRSPSTQNLLL